MAAALALARRGRGRVAPNPAVAALIVRGGRLLARGVTAPGGRPHAEAVALAALAAGGGSAAGATVYVTLEPCAHHGRTPPCADALIAAGVARVVCPIVDPDPRVSGRGFARLGAAGIEVVVGPCAEEAAAVNDGFLSVIERRRPVVTLKLATSLDGRIATGSGESRWITGARARLRVHAMRAEADAVMVGAGTARADDPMLDVRGLGPAAPRPVRVVADPALSLPPGGRLATTARERPVWLLHRAMAAGDDAMAGRAARLAELGLRLLPVAVEDGTDAPAGDGAAGVAGMAQDAAGVTTSGAAAGVSAGGGGVLATDRRAPGQGQGTGPAPATALAPAAMLARLGLEGINGVFCEGGGRLAASLIAAGLVDRLVTVGAGVAIGADGVPALGPLGLAGLAAAPRFTLERLEEIDGDVLAVWRPA